MRRNSETFLGEISELFFARIFSSFYNFRRSTFSVVVVVEVVAVVEVVIVGRVFAARDGN